MGIHKEVRPFDVADIEAGYSNPEWCGSGYLGARRTLPQAVLSRADEFLLDHANRAGWTSFEFFGWLDGADGRWYGEVARAWWSTARSFPGSRQEVEMAERMKRCLAAARRDAA